MRTIRWAVVALLAVLAVRASGQHELSLSGPWRFALDREDAGVSQRWFDRTLGERIRLPGSLQEQGFGDEPSAQTQWTSGIGMQLLAQPKYAPYRQPGSFKTPFWLTPARRYIGPAWYQRDVEIPAAWKDRRIVLFLERAHWDTTVWVDDREAGMQNGLGVPHEHDLSALLSPGRHRLTIRVDNRVKVPVGPDAHSVSDQTQGNWNGIVGRIELRASEGVWIDDLQVYPDFAHRRARVVMEVGNATGANRTGTVRLAVASPDGQSLPPLDAPFQCTTPRQRFERTIDLGPNARPWDEFSPALYRIVAELKSDLGSTDSRQTSFGLRDLGVSGTQFTINGRRIFLRGTLECCIFPLTGYPPVDVDSWKRILRIARAHGLNHLRFHSWCPPEAAFVAADEMGFYYQVECSCWASFGDGTPVDTWIYAEADRMLKAYGNHPSFLLMVPTNEPAGKQRDAFLGKLISHWAKTDSRRMYTAGSGWPMIPENQYHVTPTPRMQASNELTRRPQTMSDYRQFISRQKVPVVSHEIAQWCVYPNFDEIPKYTGSLKPGNLEIFRDFLAKSGQLSQAHDFLMASGKFQALLYKAEIEEALRTPGMAGFQLLDLHDFPGQGTAPVGVLDALWDSKGYIRPEEYHRFCSETVPLARLPKRVFTADESATIGVEVAHFGPADLVKADARWRVRTAAGKVLQEGALTARDVPTGALTDLGKVTLNLGALPTPARLIFEVRLGESIANDWDFWVYPAVQPWQPAAGVRIARSLDDAAIAALERGEKVFLLPRPQRIAGQTLGTFRPIFWNRITFPAQREHTLGILCDPAHPALAQFPTDSHTNWQWWNLQENAKPMVLDGLGAQVKPLIQMIDDWDVCRRLALAFEARVGKGQLMVCSIDLEHNLESRPVARQLLQSLCSYMVAPAFAPQAEVSVEQLQSLLRDPTGMQKLGARIIRADSEEAGYPASNILDGNPATLWHTAWTPEAPPFPHEVVIGLDRAVTIRGCRLLPRQDHNSNGFIKEYAIYASSDGKQWGEPLASGSFDGSAEWKEVLFSRPAETRFLRLVARSGFDRNAFASLAELEVIGK